MKYSPSLETIKAYAESGAYKILPVSCELLADLCTPIEALRRLKQVSTHCYLLESVAEREKWGRYTFLGFDPKLDITCSGRDMKIGDVRIKTEHPAQQLRQILAEYKSPRLPELPPFTGGLVGYFSYDFLKYAEPSVDLETRDTENFKDVDLMLFDKVIAFDHFRQKIILIANMSLEDPETGYNKAVMELESMAALLKTDIPKQEQPGHLLGDFTPLFDRESYCDMVEQAKHHIREGDIFQIVLSNRLAAPYTGSLLNTYRILRTLNPSPYMFYFSGMDVEWRRGAARAPLALRNLTEAREKLRLGGTTAFVLDCGFFKLGGKLAHRSNAGFFRAVRMAAAGQMPVFPQRFFGRERQRERKLRSLAKDAGNGDLSAVLFDDFFDDGKAKPSTPGFFGMAFIYTIETFEDTIRFIFRYSDSSICDTDFLALQGIAYPDG